MTQAQPLGARDLPDHQYGKALAAKWMKGMGYLGRSQSLILVAIFEADFCDVSYEYRPGRNPHHALRALREQIVTKKVGHVFEADIRGYFTHVSHLWMQRMVRERIADPVILSLIGKWLKAGVMQNGVVV